MSLTASTIAICTTSSQRLTLRKASTARKTQTYSSSPDERMWNSAGSITPILAGTVTLGRSSSQNTISASTSSQNRTIMTISPNHCPDSETTRRSRDAMHCLSARGRGVTTRKGCLTTTLPSTRRMTRPSRRTLRRKRRLPGESLRLRFPPISMTLAKCAKSGIKTTDSTSHAPTMLIACTGTGTSTQW